MRPTLLLVLPLLFLVPLIGACSGRQKLHFEQRNLPAYMRGPHNSDFFYRHYRPYQFGAAVHFAHGKAHDVPQLTPLAEAEFRDRAFEAECVNFIYNPPHSEPSMMEFGPYTGRFAWNLYRAIDWTHVHHEQTYDILSSKQIPWQKKKEWTDRAVRAYLQRMPGTARSVAPLDVTMRRAGVMMKPYFTLWRNNYPNSNNFFFMAHWWHPVIYEAMMIAGNDVEQNRSVRQAHELFTHVNDDRPQRMLLSREIMPRYSRLSPESANIFDNLHMLHGIAYDILSYDGWNEDQKRAELYRVIEAMSHRPGDEELARKFSLPHPDMDPRVYADWMKPLDGEMSRIMREMLMEMWPMHSPDGSAEPPQAVMEQFRLKMTPGIQDGEHPGSLHDALMKVVPDMKMTPEMREAMKPGKAPQMMIDMMLQGWRDKYAGLADVEPIDMSADPPLPPTPAPATRPATRLAARAAAAVEED